MVGPWRPTQPVDHANQPGRSVRRYSQGRREVSPRDVENRADGLFQPTSADQESPRRADGQEPGDESRRAKASRPAREAQEAVVALGEVSIEKEGHDPGTSLRDGVGVQYPRGTHHDRGRPAHPPAGAVLLLEAPLEREADRKLIVGVAREAGPRTIGRLDEPQPPVFEVRESPRNGRLRLPPTSLQLSVAPRFSK